MKKAGLQKLGDKSPIVFFDGVCGLCHLSVRLLLAIDKKQKLYYAPLQGKSATELLGISLPSSSTLVFYINKEIYTHSSAILESLKTIGGPCRAAAYLMRLCPQAIRDRLYTWIALRRYKLFTKFESCRIPAKVDKERFLP